MSEPPAKRARRVDSSTMWDMNDRNTRSPEPHSDLDRSPRREAHPKADGRRDDRSRERHHDRRGYPSKGDRYRSRSPVRNGNRDSRTPPRGPRTERRGDRRDVRAHENGSSDSKLPRRAKDDMDMDVDDVDGDDVEEMMRRSMGFTKFRSTKNTKVPGNDIYGVRKEKKTEYRQYMNRVGGFNRPLSPSR
ncbi:hypothetical protein HFD88_001926 [Aspergillus terreus]|nr:hypothetical protein HFD88_001926 [Aspergillus terreus]